MIVRTTWRFQQAADVIWPLLCGSQMDAQRDPLARFGLPQPRQCSLPDGSGGVGTRRRCDSDCGYINQTILTWDPPHRLAFQMTETNLPIRRYVTKLIDEFDLTPAPTGETLVTRTTHLKIAGRLAFIRKGFLWIGLRRIHRFVFQNWSRLAAGRAASPAG